MPIPFARLLPPVAVVALLALPVPARTELPAAPDTGQADAGTYTVQSGDTLGRIARKLGFSPDALVRANALSHPDRLTPGHILRLPVTESPAAAKAAQAKPLATAAPARPEADQPAKAEATPSRAEPAQAKAASDTAPPRQPAPGATAEAAPSGGAPGPATPKPSAKFRAYDIDRHAAGIYKHPSLGLLRLNQSADGIVLTKDNQSIPMRHLLYAIYDGTDATGNVHNFQLVFGADGQVEALRYSTAGTGNVTFDKVKK